MTLTRLVKAGGSVAAFAAIVLAGMWITPQRGRAAGDQESLELQSRAREAKQINRGFEVAPVPLNMVGKDPNLVGLGSYIVNVQSDCNGCHTNDPSTEYAGPGLAYPGGNPYFSQKKKINTATYLGGGSDFGPFGPTMPHLLSRNLTPDKTGLPEGGHTFEEFLKIMRTGVDMDHLHPTCSATVTTNCFPPPFNGDLLQVMPWPTFQEMSDHEIRAIYEYLSAIPCVAGPADPKNPLHNNCQ